jgi:predicted DNA binding CopG/RHH family protein
VAPAAASKSTAKKRRGSETRQRSRILNLRVSPEEEAKIRQAAAAGGVQVTTYLRKALELETA